MAHHVGPELDDLTAYNCLRRDGKTASECAPDRTVGCGIVKIGNRGPHQISHDVGIVRSPATVIALAPHGAACGPEETAAKAACAFLKIAGIFFQYACQHRVAEKIAGKVVGVSRTVSLGVSLHTLSILREAIVGLIDAGAE